MIGNAVPVNLAYFLAETIKHQIIENEASYITISNMKSKVSV